MNVLMVAEKPILAEAIAKILSNGKCHKRKGMNGVCSVFEYKANFQGRPANFRVTSTLGHVMCVDFPARYKLWRVDPEELFLCPIVHKEANPKLTMPAFLASEANGCDVLVLWLDCDKEGENICYEVLSCVRNAMLKRHKDGAFMQRVYRARFSAISDAEIRRALKMLSHPNKSEARQVDARAELDLRVGCAFTRLQTKFLRKKYIDLPHSYQTPPFYPWLNEWVTFGPCQTPTLAFCVRRHAETDAFKSQQYWVLQAEVELPNNGGGDSCQTQTLTLDWCRPRQLNGDTAQEFFNKVKECTTATVSENLESTHCQQKPVALHTVELLKVASTELGLSPGRTMELAQWLYTSGYVSYPRTETTAYPDDFDFEYILRKLTGMEKIGEIVRKLLREGISAPRKGTHKGDHPPITPMKAQDYRGGGMNEGYGRVHDRIVRHFLATLMLPCEYTLKNIIFDIGGEKFLHQSRLVIEPGFTVVLEWMALQQHPDQQTLTEVPLSVGQQLVIRDMRLVKRWTVAPDYLTEAEVISLMEQHGIGTDASIPGHIDNICKRNCVQVETKYRRLVPTALGMSLVHGYQRLVPDLVLPTLRASVERQLDQIAKKSVADFTQMKIRTLQIFRDIFRHFERNIHEMDELFQVYFTTKDGPKKPFIQCRKCFRFMLMVNIQRLLCPICQQQQNDEEKGPCRKLRAADGALSFNERAASVFCEQQQNNSDELLDEWDDEWSSFLKLFPFGF